MQRLHPALYSLQPWPLSHGDFCMTQESQRFPPWDSSWFRFYSASSLSHLCSVPYLDHVNACVSNTAADIQFPLRTQLCSNVHNSVLVESLHLYPLSPSLNHISCSKKCKKGAEERALLVTCRHTSPRT